MDMTEKNPFSMLSMDEQEELAKLTPSEIKSKMAATVLAELDNKRNQKEDQQLKEAKEAVKKAQKAYKERTAKNTALVEAHTLLADSMDSQSLKDKLAEVAMDQLDNDAAESEDEELKSLKESAKEAAAGYKDASKRHKQLISYCKQLLGDKGAA